MVTQLKGLLGKNKRPIVVNGELLKNGRNLVVACLNNYKVEFSLLGTNTEWSVEKGTTFINERISKFVSDFGGILGKDIGADEATAYVDAFSGAVIIETLSYQALSAEHMHDRNVQHAPQVAQLLTRFLAEYTYNYMDIFVYLFNRRIAASHAPIITRGHFVAGLFQPLIVETKALRSPLSFGGNAWVLDIFAEQAEWLERSQDYARGLNLNCVASCDIASVFGVPVVTQMDRKNWMLMLELCLLTQLEKERGLQLRDWYGLIFNSIIESDAQRGLFAAMMDYTNKLRTGVRVV